MIKHSIALAAVTALTAGSAFAQSSVTVYGRLNTSAEYQKNINVDGTQSVLQNNASRLGFKGVEDLGGGMKADFLMEHRFSSDTGTVTSASGFWAGDVWVGLTTNFGYFRAGRMTSAAYYATADWVSMHNHDTGTSADALYTYLGQDKNTISYTTPSFSGFTVEGSVSAGEGARDSTGAIAPNKVWNLAANYDGGPLQVGAGYEQVDKTSDDQFGIRAAYTMGDLTFGGYYQYSNIDGLGSRNNFRLSGMYTMGASEFHLNVGFADDWSSLNDSAANQYTVAYNYNLSKRTKIYAFYTMVDNSSAATRFSVGATDKKTGALLDPSSFAVGVRHNF